MISKEPWVVEKCLYEEVMYLISYPCFTTNLSELLTNKKMLH